MILAKDLGADSVYSRTSTNINKLWQFLSGEDFPQYHEYWLPCTALELFRSSEKGCNMMPYQKCSIFTLFYTDLELPEI